MGSLLDGKDRAAGVLKIKRKAKKKETENQSMLDQEKKEFDS